MNTNEQTKRTEFYDVIYFKIILYYRNNCQFFCVDIVTDVISVNIFVGY